MEDTERVRDRDKTEAEDRWLPAEYVPGLVSVVIPTYNRGEMLVDAMNSAFAQAYRPIELVVVDDGSTDSTREIVQTWQRAHGADSEFTLRYLWQENRGAPAARNLGARESRGQYIQFLDSDDYLDERRFQAILNSDSLPAVWDMVVTSYVYVTDKGEVLEREAPGDAKVEDLVQRCIRRSLWTSAPLYAREFLATVGPWRENLPCWEDWEYGVRVALKCIPQRAEAIDDVLCYHRVHGSGRITSEASKPVERAVRAAVEALSEATNPRQLWYDTLSLRLLHWTASIRDEDVRWLLRLPSSAWLRCQMRALLAISSFLRWRQIIRIWANFMWRFTRTPSASTGRRWLTMASFAVRRFKEGGLGWLRSLLKE